MKMYTKRKTQPILAHDGLGISCKEARTKRLAVSAGRIQDFYSKK